MLDFRDISVHYGHQDVLSNVTFRVNKGDRVGVVGPNGSGKSTLFKIVLGEMSTDKGELIIEGSPRIGWTRQNPEPDNEGETLLAPVRAYAEKFRYSRYCVSQTEICRAKLGNDAGIIGAAVLGL